VRDYAAPVRLLQSQRKACVFPCAAELRTVI
jgi:hypothetical protein